MNIFCIGSNLACSGNNTNDDIPEAIEVQNMDESALFEDVSIERTKSNGSCTTEDQSSNRSEEHLSIENTDNTQYKSLHEKGLNWVLINKEQLLVPFVGKTTKDITNHFFRLDS